MSFLESAKQYTGSDLETIFFRPILSGDSARELGVRVLYNMPVPTTIQLWDGQRNVLQKYSAAGWTGGNAATKLQKTISLGRVKAELGFSAADYFSLVYEKIAARADVNMDDLTGTELEQAETALFKQAVAESIRATMWVGDTSAASGYNTFDGFLKTVKAGAMQEKFYNSICQAEDFSEEEDSYEVITDPDNFSAVREALEKAGIPMVEADITMIPQNWVELTDEEAIKKMQRILDLLDEDDDVQAVYHNWDE